MMRYLFPLWLFLTVTISEAAVLPASEAVTDPVPKTVIDYAAADQRHAWLSHPALGELSFDAWTQAEQPLLRGADPLAWPVNPFLFIDRGVWYAYVGFYPRNYALLQAPNQMQCRLWRSRDRGTSWEALGNILPERFRLDGLGDEVLHAPDVSVVASDGRYHLVFDFLTASSTWETAAQPTGVVDGGVGYAWADKPEGPWHVSPRPLLLNSQRSRQPLDGRFGRYYASTLLRRAHDWLLLTAVDSGRFHAWGLTACTARDPAGPWSEPQLIVAPNGRLPLPAPLEFFPAYVIDGQVHAPATSVRVNRNVVAMVSAPLERAHEASAWTLSENGGNWHSEPVEWQHSGLWGQCPAIAKDGHELIALFPSRDRAGNGTIGVARRPAAQPYRDGPKLSANEGACLVHLSRAYDDFTWDIEMAHQGLVGLRWGVTQPLLGAEHTHLDRAIDPHCWNGAQGVELEATTWRVVTCDAAGVRQVRAEGAHAGATRIRINRASNGNTQVTLDDSVVFNGPLPAGAGALGFGSGPHSSVHLKRAIVSGTPLPTVVRWLGLDAINHAGEAADDWIRQADASCRSGTRWTRRADGGRAVWVVRGKRLTLYMPKQEGARVAMLLDGKSMGELACDGVPWKHECESDVPHVLLLTPVRGKLEVDCLEGEFLP